MDLQERLAQCQVDKAAIESKEQELLDQIKEKEQKIPFARLAYAEYGGRKARLILHLMPAFVHLVNEYKGRVVALGHYGLGDDIIICCNTTDNITVDNLVAQYKDVQTLID